MDSMIRHGLVSLVVLLGATGCVFSQDLGQPGSGGTGGQGASGGAGALGGGGAATGGSGAVSSGGSGGSGVGGSGVGGVGVGGSGVGGSGVGGSGTGGSGTGGSSANCPANPGSQGEVIASGQDRPLAIALDASTVYFTNWGPINGNDSSVNKVDKAGGTVDVLTNGLTPCTDLSVEGSELLFGTLGQSPPNGLPAELDRISVSGGTSTHVTGGFMFIAHAVIGSTVYFTDNFMQYVPLSGGMPQPLDINPQIQAVGALTKSGTTLYFTGSLVSSPPPAMLFSYDTQTSLESMSSIASYGSAIATDGTHVLWGDEDNGLWEIPASGIGNGVQPVLLASGKIEDVVTDGQYAYFADYQSGDISKVPVTGGSIVTLAAGEEGTSRLAVDATHLYWTNGCFGQVKRIAK
jgi:hypothetical protein